jgi:predicted nucleotidyltransferase
MADGLNKQAAWRLELARRLAGIIQTFAGVRAILVAGSVARGWADEYSDLEIAIFWDPAPSDEQRLEMITALGGRLLYGYDGPSQEDQLLIDGFQVDLWQNTVAQEEAVFEAVLRDHVLDMGSSNFLDTVRAGIALYGEDLIANWKEKAAQYPREAAAQVVRDLLPEFHLGYLEVLIRRDALPAFYAQVVRLQQVIFLTLLALNRAYFPTYKWMLPVLEKLETKPDDVIARFRQALTGPTEETAADMQALVEETLRLVETHLPEVDTTSARQRMAYRRAVFSAPPGSRPRPAPV